MLPQTVTQHAPLTSSALVTQVGESPHVAETHAVSDAGQRELCRRRPLSAPCDLWLRLGCRRALSVQTFRRLLATTRRQRRLETLKRSHGGSTVCPSVPVSLTHTTDWKVNARSPTNLVQQNRSREVRRSYS